MEKCIFYCTRKRGEIVDFLAENGCFYLRNKANKRDAVFDSAGRVIHLQQHIFFHS